MIVIRHQTGPLAGKEQKIEAKSERITFGRDPQVCDVVYPADETLVARRHFALVKKLSGEWTFDLFGDLFVAMDGQPVDQAEALREGAKIELGRHGGPSFEAHVIGEALGGDLPVTQTQEEVEGAHAAAGRAQRAVRRYALAGIVLLVAIAVVGGGLWYQSHLDVARLTEETRRQQQEIAAKTISPAVRDKLIRAAYYVVARKADGTAYSSASAVPIGPGVLGTNAHVAEMFEELPAGGSLFVRSPGADGKEYKVISAHMHPGYNAFLAFMKEDPFFSSGGRVDPVPAYDVGILRVAQGTDLGPIFELATREEVADLKPGFPLAMAGYPSEAISAGKVLQFGATPTYSAGMVTAITDMFQLPGDAAHSHMVHHNLPSAGGASGSPMVGPNGKIYAFNNAGEAFSVSGQPGRIPSGALQNYAQRADLVRDMVEEKAAAVVQADRAYWLQQTAGLKRGINVVVEGLLRKATIELFKSGDIPTNVAPVLISKEKVALTTAERYKDTKREYEFDKTGAIVSKDKEITKRQKMFPIKLTAGKAVALIVYAENFTVVDLWLYDGRKSLKNDQGSHFAAVVAYKPTSDMSAQAYVTAPDVDTNITFFVYSWGALPSS